MLTAMDPVRLTSLSHGAGCACKLGPAQLAEVMSELTLPGMPSEVLVDAATSDDAAVYLPPGAPQAVVASTDFFTPIVDEPFDWGRIAAANAVSDIYAMGGDPAFALNLVAWPADDLPMAMLGEVLAGGADIAGAAGMAVVGGHSITDPEPKYGMAVIGLVDPARIVRNSGARAGDRLVLTKPLGPGMIATAIKREVATTRLRDAAVDSMTELNDRASQAMRKASVSAATDVTGFGLIGHAHELASASHVQVRLDAAAIPLLEGVLDLAQRDVVAGGTKRNHAHFGAVTDQGTLDLAEQLVLADAQTSGGLLIATGDPEGLSAALRERGVDHWQVGRVEEGPSGRIVVEGRLGSIER